MRKMKVVWKDGEKKEFKKFIIMENTDNININILLLMII